MTIPERLIMIGALHLMISRDRTTVALFGAVAGQPPVGGGDSPLPEREVEGTVLGSVARLCWRRRGGSRWRNGCKPKENRAAEHR